jgi:hypothetical protein
LESIDESIDDRRDNDTSDGTARSNRVSSKSGFTASRLSFETSFLALRGIAPARVIALAFGSAD